MRSFSNDCDREIQLKKDMKVILHRNFQISLNITKEGYSYIDFKHAYNVISNGSSHQIRAVKLDKVSEGGQHLIRQIINHIIRVNSFELP